MAGKKKTDKDGSSWIGEVEKYSRQIWLAGLGAYSKISNDGSKLFETLVKDGEKAEKQTKVEAQKQLDEVKDTAKTAKSRVGDVKDLAVGKWNELEGAFDKRLNSAISRLGVPSRNEVQALHSKVDQLTRQIELLTGEKAKPVASRAAAAKPAPKTAAKPLVKAAAKTVAKTADKTAQKTAAAKPAVKKAAAKPVDAASKAATATASKAKPAAAKKPAARKPAAKPAAAPAPAVKAEPAKPAPAPARAPAPTGEKPVATEAETTVRVDTARLDEIMNMVGELVLVRNRLVRLGLNSGDEAMSKAVSNLDVVTADLQTAVMKTRMQPIKKVFGRFPRLVRDLARQLKKEINLELVGEETDLDKNLVEALADPLVHLVRNAVDHGIETPEEREASGKSRGGKVILSAEQEGDHILLSISDDGKGMDPNVLRSIAVKRGVMDKDAADRLSDTDCYNLIFAPGFSTKTEISDVSGRGVGMDVVKTKISQLNGSINIYSTKGQGSKIVIKVPLTLAIMPTLMVMLGNQAFAFPLVNVNEIFHLNLSTTNVVDGQEVVIVRDKALPLFYLKRWLVSSAAHEEQREGHVVILTVGTQRIGFVVDQLVGQEEVVIKPLGKMLQGTPGMSGATITGDGRIALILDVPSMLKRYAARRI
ncbi:Chemotaxis sensor histidine kinase CheA [Pseudomonas syringae pv. broussonetiae]|nr:Chemotaxis sensor histidine kinase CheA [Pseudomonas syringae pv. broussonetiae]